MLQAIFMAKCHLSRNKKVLHYWRLLEQSIEVLLKFQVFICHLAAAVSLLETKNTKDFITGLPILSRYELFGWLVSEKLRSAYSILGPNIN